MSQPTETAEYADCISVESFNECPIYDSKQSDSELELWVMLSTPSLSLPPSTLLLGVEVPDRILSMSK